jgi:signal transduction histidine kinase
MMALAAAAKGVELIIDVAADIPAQLTGDPHRVRQCLMNLVGNAVKFTASGEILLRVALAEPTEGRRSLRFEVHDTGIGIAQEALATLFEPFVQAETSTTRRFGGTGLGLSIVKKLVELMGGEIRVSSATGKGSVFSIVLPSRRRQRSRTPNPRGRSMACSKVAVYSSSMTTRPSARCWRAD